MRVKSILGLFSRQQIGPTMSYWAKFVFVCVNEAVCFKKQLLLWPSQTLLPGRVGWAHLGKGGWNCRESIGVGSVGKVEDSPPFPPWEGLRAPQRSLALVLQSCESLKVVRNEQNRPDEQFSIWAPCFVPGPACHVTLQSLSPVQASFSPCVESEFLWLYSSELSNVFNLL